MVTVDRLIPSALFFLPFFWRPFTDRVILSYYVIFILMVKCDKYIVALGFSISICKFCLGLWQNLFKTFTDSFLRKQCSMSPSGLADKNPGLVIVTDDNGVSVSHYNQRRPLSLNANCDAQHWERVPFFKVRVMRISLFIAFVRVLVAFRQ